MVSGWGYEKAGKYTLAALCIVALVSVAILAGCGDSREAKQKEYREEYVRIIDDFEDQVAKDDQKAEELVEQDDLGGLIRLNETRLEFIDEVFGEILDLYPPEELRKVHALTLFYLVAVRDQVEAQSDYYEALLSGKPSEDLKSITENSAGIVRLAGASLALELQKQDIEIKSMQQQSEQPQTSSPQSVPQSSAP